MPYYLTMPMQASKNARLDDKQAQRCGHARPRARHISHTDTWHMIAVPLLLRLLGKQGRGAKERALSLNMLMCGLTVSGNDGELIGHTLQCTPDRGLH